MLTPTQHRAQKAQQTGLILDALCADMRIIIQAKIAQTAITRGHNDPARELAKTLKTSFGNLPCLENKLEDIMLQAGVDKETTQRTLEILENYKSGMAA